jgi:hypothetical protein
VPQGFSVAFAASGSAFLVTAKPEHFQTAS